MSNWDIDVGYCPRDPGWCHEFISKEIGLTSYCPMCGMIWAWWLDAWVDPTADVDGVVRRLPPRDRYPTPGLLDLLPEELEGEDA